MMKVAKNMGESLPGTKAINIIPRTRSPPLTSSSSSSSSSSPPLSSSSLSADEKNEDLLRLEHAPPFWRNNDNNPNACGARKKLSKQLSLREIPRDMAWERRRRQFLDHDLTDEDLSELKGCIELGFGFNEENGQRLCTTIPALDLYFAVNRQFSTSPVLSPNSNGSSSNVGGSPMSDSESNL